MTFVLAFEVLKTQCRRELNVDQMGKEKKCRSEQKMVNDENEKKRNVKYAQKERENVASTVSPPRREECTFVI